MSVIVVSSTRPGGGKTTIAAGLALAAYYRGLRTGILRLQGQGAEADAAFYATQPFAAPPSGEPVAPSDVRPRSERYDAGILLVEAGGIDEAALVAAENEGRIVLVAAGPGAADELLAAAAPLKPRLAGVAALAVPARELAAVRSRIREAGLPLLAALAEDRTLHAPSIADVARATGARVLLGEAREDVIAENILIAPIGADPAVLYYQKYPNKLVIARSDKPELHLSAVSTSTNALLLTGGIIPMSYTFDRLANERIPLLLASGDTVDTVARLQDLFAASRFHSPRKLERLEELLRQELDLGPLGLPAAVNA